MKRIVIIAACSSLLLALALTAASFFYFETVCRQKPIVCVDDDLYEIVSADPENAEPAGFCILSRSQFEKQSQKKPVRSKTVCAFITTEKTFDFAVPENTYSKKYYPLKKTSWFPVVKDNFETHTKTGMQIVPPVLDIDFATLESMPSESRALTVKGVYAGEDSYAFRETLYAVCSIIDTAKAELLDKWCRSCFEIQNTDEQKTVFVSAVGDIMAARGVEDILITDKDGLDKVFGTTLEVLQNNDLLLGNLEGPVTANSENATKTYTFKFKKKLLDELKKCGFNYFMVTNNHCYDYGENGFEDTLSALQEAGIPTSGAGRNISEAKKFYHTEVHGQKFSIISCGAYPVEKSGFNGKTTATATENRAGILWQSDELIESIIAEKKAGNCVLVCVHGGEEYQFVPTEEQKDFYEKLCKAGACAVFGSHPHVLQPSVWLGKSFIAYSLGNFVFNGMEDMYGAQESRIVRLGIIDGKIVYCEQYPAQLDKTRVFLK